MNADKEIKNYFIPVNGYIEITSTSENEAYKMARAIIGGAFEYEFGEADCMDDWEDDE